MRADSLDVTDSQLYVLVFLSVFELIFVLVFAILLQLWL